jgi:hypothetical protein
MSALQHSDSIRSMMNALSRGLSKILGPRLIGVYLGGSLVLGDFQEATSDLDFLVITDGHLSVEDALAVSLMHRDLVKRHPHARRLQGDYAPQELLVPEGTLQPVPGCEHGRFLPRVPEIMISADNIFNMREHGLTIYGPAASEVLPVVTCDHVRSAIREMLRDGLGAIVSPEEAASETLNLVRSFLTLETGTPSTKSQGAEWGLCHLDERWHPVIRAAVAIRAGQGDTNDLACIQTDLPQMQQMLQHLYV